MCLDADTAPRSAGTNQQPPAPLMFAPQEPPLQALLKARQAHEAGCVSPMQKRARYTLRAGSRMRQSGSCAAGWNRMSAPTLMSSLDV